MLRRLFTLLSAVSLLLCVAMVVLWVRSVRGSGEEDRVSGMVRGNRYTGYSRHGRLVITGPPPPPESGDVRRSVEDLAGGLRNDQIVWNHWPTYRPAAHEFEYSIGYLADWAPGTTLPRAGTVAARLERQHSPADCSRALLAALEDPDRFVAAHVLLAARSFNGHRHYGPGADRLWDVTSIHTNYFGMTLGLRRPSGGDGDGVQPGAVIPSVDPAQLPVVRDLWHRRLDVPLLSVPHWFAASAAALPPLVWAAARAGPAWARRLRRRSRRCVSCGYDLRATPGRCPECGAVPAERI